MDNEDVSEIQGEEQWRADWQSMLESAKQRPAMYIGGLQSAHYTALFQPLNLCLRAQAFESLKNISVHLSPTQYVVIANCGPLVCEIEEMFQWREDAHDIADGWHDKMREISHKCAADFLKNGVRADGWLGEFSSSTGTGLDGPIIPGILAYRLVVSYRVSHGYWCQGYTNGWPTPRPFVFEKKSSVGLVAAASLDPEWFTGLPFVRDRAHEILAKSGVAIKWHDADDMIPSELSTEELLQKWL
jgi:hypothetical protein